MAGAYPYLARRYGTRRVGGLLTRASADFRTASYQGLAFSHTGGPGYALNVAGVWVSFAANTLRRTDRGLTVENAATNLLTDSDAMVTGYAKGVGSFYTISASPVAAPKSGASAFRAVCATSNDLFVRKSGISVPVGVHTASLHIYVPTQSGTTDWRFLSDLNDVDSGFDVSSSLFDQWVRAKSAITVTAARTVIDFNMRRNGFGTPPVGFEFYFTLPQLEAGSAPTSYIPTAAATVTRPADVVTTTLPSGTSRIVYTFDDGSTQEVAASAGSYTIPTTLDRPVIAAMAVY